MVAHLTMGLGDHRIRPGLGRLALFDELVEARAEARGIILEAARRVEVDGLERADEGPAPAEPLGDRLVDILGGRDSGLKQAKSFP